jgi:hypothetical protein
MSLRNDPGSEPTNSLIQLEGKTITKVDILGFNAVQIHTSDGMKYDLEFEQVYLGIPGATLTIAKD